MNKSMMIYMLFSFLLLAVGCDSEDSTQAEDSDADGDSDVSANDDDDDNDSDACQSSDTIRLVDSNNYHFDGSLDIKSYPLAELGDPLIDWSGLTKDLQRHDLAPESEIDYSAVIVLNNLTEEEVASRLSSNTLDQSYITAYLSFDTEGATSAHLSDYTVFGNDIDIETFFEDGYGVWLVIIASGSTPGVGTRMAAFLKPEPSATAVQVEMTNESTVLNFDVDLTSLDAIAIAEGKSDFILEWEELTQKGDGSEFVAREPDQVMLAHYPDMAVEEIEDNFLDIEFIADGMWTASVSSGTSIDFNELYSSDGPFTGIDSEGTWILALRCTECANPAPPFLTILTACP